MATIETATVVTAVFHHVFRYARGSDEAADLARAVVEDPPDPVCELYVRDRPCLPFTDPEGPLFPGCGRLRVSSWPSLGWGALNYVGPSENVLVDSFNPEAFEARAVLFDPEGDLWFPASASLPPARVRDAVEEYARTGQRPTCVQWQEGHWY
ncbi:Imm1 family immunity protein [Salinifilum ghardaiensis]